VRQISILVAAALLSLATFQCEAQGTAFTYQGRLNANGGVANGGYDFQFILFNASRLDLQSARC
jgi:hypothetical protein